MAKIYSEKLGKLVSITAGDMEADNAIVMNDSNDSLVGWSHSGWNNDNGGGSNW